MRAYYVVDYDGLRTSPTIDIPEGLNKEQAVTYTYGEMMLEYRTLDTPHAIFINTGSGYKCHLCVDYLSVFREDSMYDRDSRDRLLELVEEGLIDPNYVILAFCKWNTREDIEDMCHANEIQLWDDEDEDDEE